ncbi:MAG TPA: cbb3-type cytochrome c oxidase subunit 3 [Candidatus Methylomirabilis sp.]|nr:cbb3-type cytochrome c oxidase subunit 3 [Candidatus Methylomirabilis sp.]
MDLVTFHSWLTVAMFIAFVALIVWAWSGKRRRAFDEAARLPLEDDDSDLLPLSPRGRGQGERGEPLIPTPSPSRGEGGEPSALRATLFTRGDKKHG